MRDIGDSSVEEQLSEQFRYFRKEFLEVAASTCLTLPLDLTGEKTSQVLVFVKYNGPKILVQLVQNNIESVHLLRCALSLLIITVTVLRRHFDVVSNDSQVSNSISNSISAMAQLSLVKFTESGVVTLCMSVLIYSFNTSVQELAINLLSIIVSLSKEAATQMTWIPNSVNGVVTSILPQSSSSADASKPSKAPLSSNNNTSFKKHDFQFNDASLIEKKKVVKEQQSTDEPQSCLAHILAVCLLQKNQHLLLAGCADIMLSMIRWNPSAIDIIASTATCKLPAAGMQVSGKSNAGNRTNSKFNNGVQSTIPPINPLGNQVIEWAGLKLLLKFLHRYLKVTQFAPSDSFPRENVAATIRSHSEHAFSHLKIYIVACQLICGSEVVANYANELPGVADLIQMSAGVHYPYSQEVEEALQAATTALQRVKMERLRRLSEEEEAAAANHNNSGNHTSQKNRPRTQTANSGGLSVEDLRVAAEQRGEHNNTSATETKRTSAAGGNRMSSSKGESGGGPNNRGAALDSVNDPTTVAGVSSNAGPGRRASDVTAGSESNYSDSRYSRGGIDSSSRDSQAKQQTQHVEQINLVSNINVNFESPVYEVETEKRKLFLLLRSLDSAADAAAAAELIYQENLKRRDEPLPLEREILGNAPSDAFSQTVDDIEAPRSGRPATTGSSRPSSRPTLSGGGYVEPAKLSTLSIRTIQAYSASAADRQAEYEASRRGRSSGKPGEFSEGGSVETPNFFKLNNDGFGGGSDSSGRNNNNNNNTTIFPSSPNTRGKRNTESLLPPTIHSKKDFFDRLPREPFLPGRVKLKDGDAPKEDLDLIREKFREIAADAVHTMNSRSKYRLKYMILC